MDISWILMDTYGYSWAIQKREVGEDSEIFAGERIYQIFFSKGTSPHNQELFLPFVREQMIKAA
jgi:hypothetical protein